MLGSLNSCFWTNFSIFNRSSAKRNFNSISAFFSFFSTERSSCWNTYAFGIGESGGSCEKCVLGDKPEFRKDFAPAYYLGRISRLPLRCWSTSSTASTKTTSATTSASTCWWGLGDRSIVFIVLFNWWEERVLSNPFSSTSTPFYYSYLFTGLA